MGKSILVVYTKPVVGKEGDFDEWYSSVHLPEVVRLDGFVAARRYRFVPEKEGELQPDLPYLAIYEVDDGMLEKARAALAEALNSSRAALKAGQSPQLMPSDSLHPDWSVSWFEEIAQAP